jgi:simple sugar transport system permease protein
MRRGVWIAGIPLLSLVPTALLVFVLSKTPGKTFWFFFLGPFQNLYYLGNMINSAVPLIFGGLGVCIAMQGNRLNLGGEGQVYAGGFVAAALSFAPLGVPGAILALAAGGLVAAFIASLSGLMRAYRGVNELISSFLLSNALILIVNYLITGPFQDPETSLQSTGKLALHLPLILPPSNLSGGLFCALAAAFLVHVFLYRTLAGYELRISGMNEHFARYGGIDTVRSGVLAMSLSGFLYGLAGGMAVYGAYHAAVKDFSSGMGWNGLAAALLARSRPRYVIPAALFFAWISYGARLAMQFSDVTLELASIVQALFLLFFTSYLLPAAPRAAP